MKPSAFALATLIALSAPSLALSPSQPPDPGPSLAGQPLLALSDSVETLVRRVHPSVVKIAAMGFDGKNDEGTAAGIVTRARTSGSGTIVDADGLIVTNAHVLAGAERVQVTVPADTIPGRPGGGATMMVAAQVLGSDPVADVALLKVPLTGLPYLPLDASVTVRQGQAVLAFGSPMGLDDSVTLGIVSSPARQLEPGDPVAYIQTDAPINPGNSGGPLVDAEGRVVGISTMILSQSGGSEGIGFALPVDLVATVVQQLRRTGRVAPGDIGLEARSNAPDLARAWQLPTELGAVVEDVEPDGPAHHAGIRPGDLIESLDGRPLTGLPALRLALYRAPIGSTLRLGILRDRERLGVEVKVRPGRSGSHRLAAAVNGQSLIQQLGVFVLDIDDELSSELGQARSKGGVLIAAQLEELPTLGEDLQVDDILYAVNRHPIASVARLRELLKSVHPGEPIAFQVERNGALRFVVMELP
jgi:serine protease Do